MSSLDLKMELQNASLDGDYFFKSSVNITSE